MPGALETVRCYSPNLIIIDEAARVPDDLYRAIRPMLVVSHGRLVALSTPFGQRGWFYDEWQGTGPWQKIRVTWHDCPRITAECIAEEERALALVCEFLTTEAQSPEHREFRIQEPPTQLSSL
jgi:hypothetical protein